MAVFTRASNDLVSYFDESMAAGPLPMMAVAGYLFEPTAYSEFDKGMKNLLRQNGMCFFRMQDCIFLRGYFERFRDTGSDVPDQIAREVIRLVRHYAILGVGAAVSEAKYELLRPPVIEKLMGGAYRMLCQWCLAEIGRWAESNNFYGKVAYFFENGCPHEKNANEALNRIATLPEFVQWYRYGSHSFIPKMQKRGLQAADMLAWFIRREAEDDAKSLAGHQHRPRRRDFQALIGNTSEELKMIGHTYKYFDDESLKSFLGDPQNCPEELRWYGILAYPDKT